MTFEEWNNQQIKSGDFDLCSGYEYAKRAFEAAQEEKRSYIEKLLQSNLDQHNKINFLSRKVNALQKENGRVEEIKANCDYQIEGRDIKIKELESEVKEWKDKADFWCKTANLKDHNIMINKKLEKENAELKAQIEKMKNCRNCKKFMIEGVCGHFLQVGWCKNWELVD